MTPSTAQSTPILVPHDYLHRQTVISLLHPFPAFRPHLPPSPIQKSFFAKKKIRPLRPQVVWEHVSVLRYSKGEEISPPNQSIDASPIDEPPRGRCRQGVYTLRPPVVGGPQAVLGGVLRRHDQPVLGGSDCGRVSGLLAHSSGTRAPGSAGAAAEAVGARRRRGPPAGGLGAGGRIPVVLDRRAW